jgi:PAS domain S-box-containing protein
VGLGEEGERVLLLRPLGEAPASAPARQLHAAVQRVEEARVAQDALLDTLFGEAPVGLGFLDPELRWVRLNPALGRLLGLAPRQQLGRRPAELWGRAGVLLERLLRRILRTGRPVVDVQLPTERLGLPGPRRLLRGSLYPVRTPAGRLLGVGGVLEDLTAHQQLEQERRRLLREAREAVQLRDDFLSIASHELKTPLTPLSLHLAMVQRRVEKGERVDPALLRQARAQLVRLTGLINDLLDAARVGDGRLSLHPAPLELEALVRRTAARAVPARDALHPLQVHAPDGPLWVRGDASRLEQVVANLVDNAVKYSPGGGPVQVEVAAQGDMAVVAVGDRGIGIPPDQQELLFDRYFHARNVPAHSYGGLGLGLYISRDIVERHGGHIWVESEVGKGSTFYVALPLLQPAGYGEGRPGDGEAPTVH